MAKRSSALTRFRGTVRHPAQHDRIHLYIAHIIDIALNITPPVICSVVAAGGQTDALYPAATSTEIDDILDITAQIDQNAAAWLPPTCQDASQQDRDIAQKAILDILHALDTRIDGHCYIIGDAITLADISLAPTMLRLYQEVLGKDVQAAYPHVTNWLMGIVAHAHCQKVLGMM